MRKYFLLYLVVFLISKQTLAQDPRVSQIMNMPMVLNPANTGNYEGYVRIGSSFAHLTNGTPKKNYFGALTNNIYNISLEQKFGKEQDWALGFNFMHSGSPRFIMSGSYSSLSLSKLFFLDTAKIYSLRLGTQVSYLNGLSDETKAGYTILMDVRAFEYFRPDGTTGQRRFISDYMNMNVGAVFNMNFDKIAFETGASLHNINKPIFGIMYDSDNKKRLRASVTTSITIDANEQNSFRIDHISWKEGIYLRGPSQYKDTSDIHETIYGFSWTNLRKSNRSIGIYSRTAKTIFINAGIDFKRTLSCNISYEHPFNRRFYNISQYGISLIYRFENEN